MVLPNTSKHFRTLHISSHIFTCSMTTPTSPLSIHPAPLEDCPGVAMPCDSVWSAVEVFGLRLAPSGLLGFFGKLGMYHDISFITNYHAIYCIIDIPTFGNLSKSICWISFVHEFRSGNLGYRDLNVGYIIRKNNAVGN